MKSRLITAAVALPVLIASIIVPQLQLLFVVLAMAAVVALFVVFVFNRIELLYLIVPLFVVAALAAEMLRGAPFDKMVLSVGSTVLGVLYVAFLGSHLIGVRTGFTNLFGDPETYLVGDAYLSHTLSTHMLSFFFLVLMGSDTGAYYTGRALGRHKLAPTVSPGKTWEGAAGGVGASLAAAGPSPHWFFPEP